MNQWDLISSILAIIFSGLEIGISIWIGVSASRFSKTQFQNEEKWKKKNFLMMQDILSEISQKQQTQKDQQKNQN